MEVTLQVTPSASETSPTTLDRGLRLVAGSWIGKAGRSASPEVLATPCLVLKSAMDDKDIRGASELLALFRSLEPGDRVDFAHTLHRDESGNAPEGMPYQFHVRVASEPGRLEELKARVSGVVASAFPALHFEADEILPKAELGYVAQYAPTGVRLAVSPAQDGGSKHEDLSIVARWPYPG
jgi:hypothetical protein